MNKHKIYQQLESERAIIWLSRLHAMFARTADAGKSDAIKRYPNALNAKSE